MRVVHVFFVPTIPLGVNQIQELTINPDFLPGGQTSSNLLPKILTRRWNIRLAQMFRNPMQRILPKASFQTNPLKDD